MFFFFFGMRLTKKDGTIDVGRVCQIPPHYFQHTSTPPSLWTAVSKVSNELYISNKHPSFNPIILQ